MPTYVAAQGHRPKQPNALIAFDALVARPVSKKEIQSNPAADASLLKEWNKQRALPTWDEKRVREWSEVAKEAKANGGEATLD